MTLKKKDPLITAEEILTKIESYDIYRAECPEFTLGRAFCNWMRGDRNPSMVIKLGEDGKLRHCDYADSSYHGDCWDLVRQKYGIDSAEAVKHVAKTFMLIDGPVDGYKAITDTYSKPLMIPQRHSLIHVTTKKWTPEAIGYWESYGITKEQLREEQVYQIATWSLNRRKQYIGENELCMCYKYTNGYKMYYPHRNKGEDKWRSNIPLDTPMHLENLSKEYNTLIVKSLKDYMVCKQIYPYTCYVQNESIGSVTSSTAQYITENSREVFYMGDSDVPGKKASHIITNAYNWRYINTPDMLLPIVNDPAGWVQLEGQEPLRKHMIKKGLIWI